MLEQCGQESSPDSAVIDTALETCLAECASKIILHMLQSLPTREKSLSERKVKMGKATQVALASPRPLPFLSGIQDRFLQIWKLTCNFLYQYVFLSVQ